MLTMTTDTTKYRLCIGDRICYPQSLLLPYIHASEVQLSATKIDDNGVRCLQHVSWFEVPRERLSTRLYKVRPRDAQKNV